MHLTRRSASHRTALGSARPDALGRLTGQTTGTGLVGYEYDLADHRTKLTWPDTFYVTYDYDTAGNLKAIKESGTTSLASFDYDSLGRRTTLTRGNGVATSYTFDNASRLTQLVSNTTGTTYDLTLDLSYNDAGQIKSRTASNDAFSWTGATNILHSDTTNGLNQVTLSGGISVGYDARGNLNASGSDSYTYSAENLLTSATVGSVTTAMTYDPLDRLYQIGTSGGMKLVYDGTAIIGQSNGTTMGRRYVTVPGSDEVLVEYKVSTGTKDYKLTDERGSVIAATDASGNGTSSTSAVILTREAQLMGAGFPTVMRARGAANRLADGTETASMASATNIFMRQCCR